MPNKNIFQMLANWVTLDVNTAVNPSWANSIVAESPVDWTPKIIYGKKVFKRSKYNLRSYHKQYHIDCGCAVPIPARLRFDHSEHMSKVKYFLFFCSALMQHWLSNPFSLFPSSTAISSSLFLFVNLPSIAMFSSSCSRMLSNASKSVTLNTCLATGADAITCNCCFVSASSKASPIFGNWKD